MTRTVLLAGDSHLGRLTKPWLAALEELVPGVDALNCAFGGATSADLARHAPKLARIGAHATVVSVGTNDSAPWKIVPVAEFRRNLESAFGALGPRVAYLSPPPHDDPRRAEADVPAYEAAAREVCTAAGAAYVDLRALFEPLDDRHEADGLHLNDAGCEALVPAIAAALAGLLPRG